MKNSIFKSFHFVSAIFIFLLAFSFAICAVTPRNCDKAFVFFDLGDTLIDTHTHDYNPMFLHQNTLEHLNLLKANGHPLGLITATATATAVSTGANTSTKSSKRDHTPRKVFDLDDEIEKSRIFLMRSEKTDGRNTTRYRVCFEVSLKFSALTINCKTIDMSLGGMWIDQQLPSEADAAMVNCSIERAGIRLDFTCCVIPDPKLKGSTRLIIKKISKPDLLRSWLLENS